jgi:hypothetical protein
MMHSLTVSVIFAFIVVVADYILLRRSKRLRPALGYGKKKWRPEAPPDIEI